jgi:hypothetical protein
MNSIKLNIDFKVDRSSLSSAETAFSNCKAKLNTYTDEVARIKDSISLLIKIAAIYSVGIKLKTSVGNLEKMAKYSGNLSSAAENVLQSYQTYENAIVSNTSSIAST